MPVFRLRQTGSVGQGIRSSEAGTPSARGLSNFRCLFLRARRLSKWQAAKDMRGILNSSGAMLKAMAIGYASG